MDAQDLLLVLTKKSRPDPELELPHPILFHYPFDRAVSRLDYRTELFNFVKATETVREVQALRLPHWTWDECCLQRAEKLREQKRDRYFIYYSGGIDSTGLLVSLLRVWPAEELKKVTLLLTHHSIEENPSFFNAHAVKFQLRNALNDISRELLESNALLITGGLGDQLFGMDILGLGCKLWGDEILKKDYREFAPRLISALVKDANAGERLFAHFHPIVDECPFPIKTVHDFFWWFNFSQKWQFERYQFLDQCRWDLRARFAQHVIHFYDTPEFQNWSLHHHDHKIGETWESYKFIAKDFIFRFTGDAAQLRLTKLQSQEKMYTLSQIRIATTGAYTAVQNTRELNNYVRRDL